MMERLSATVEIMQKKMIKKSQRDILNKENQDDIFDKRNQNDILDKKGRES